MIGISRMASLFALPNELLLSQVNTAFPCRRQQIHALTAALWLRGARSRNLLLYGLEATGKTSIIGDVLEKLSEDYDVTNINGDIIEEAPEQIRYAIINSAECITSRQLFEKTTGAIATTLGYNGTLGRCENLAQLLVDVGMLLDAWTKTNRSGKRFVLVFDGIDHQKEAVHTLVPALARLSEFTNNLSTIFIVTSPAQHFLHLQGVPHIHFPAYTKQEILQILSRHQPSPKLPSGNKDTSDTWSKYCAIIWDTMSKYSGRDIRSFRSICVRLWPKFIQPILDGQLSPTPFTKLILANRTLLQNDNILNPFFTSLTNPTNETSTTSSSAVQNSASIPASSQAVPTTQPLIAQLPTTTRLLVVASYLCSHNPPKTDITFFCKSLSVNRRRKRGGGTTVTASRPGTTKHRKISRRLLGPQAFTLERMLAVFHFLRGEIGDGLGYGYGKKKSEENRGDDVAGGAHLLSAVSTLVALKLLNRLGGGGGGDMLDGGSRYRVNVGWEVVRSIGRSLGIEVETFVAD